ncbi:GyrI-like domain-containing protein [Paramicrobacterium agarici]|uniref:GyrI-like domain-containing protein n=1 Tax=Paramicrobacterium agarici TaxID=630514 RepID=UPI00117DA361
MDNYDIKKHHRALYAPRSRDMTAFAERRKGDWDWTMMIAQPEWIAYDAEGPVIAEMHDAFIPGSDCVLTGRHHEIYLSDVRKTAPEKLRTIIRQPVERG